MSISKGYAEFDDSYEQEKDMEPRTVTNTTEKLRQPEHGWRFLADQIDNPGGTPIEDMEAAGQRELLFSDVLPVDIGHDETIQDYMALGFKFGDLVEGDEIFRYAELPEGWERRAGGNSYWSVLVDPDGNERVGIFYKAAFYDRHSHMYIRKDWEGGDAS